MDFKVVSKEKLYSMINMSDFEFKKELTKHREKVSKIKDYLKEGIPLDMFCTEETIKSVSDERYELVEGAIARSLFDENSNGNVEAIVGLAMSNIFTRYQDFFTAPASTMYHGDWTGGLADHSLAVLEAAYGMANLYLDTFEKKTIKLYPLWFILHDICKCNCYERCKKSRKNPETGKWETVECWSTRKDYISEMHGAESVSRIYQILLDNPIQTEWMALSFVDGWRLAINYHMGLYGVCDSDMINYNNAKREHPVVLLMHHADMVASQIWKF